MSRFAIADRKTPYLFPPSVEDWLPEEHLARFVVEVIDQLDLTPLTQSYRGRGSAAHHPSVLLGLLVYGYATGTFSSRKIERATYDSVAFRYIAANTHPDHDTIATFRRRFLEELEGLFVQVLELAHELKFLKLGRIALDGTKIKANASKHQALSYGHAERIETQLRAEVQELLRQAEAADQEKIPDGLDLPAEIARREARLAAIAEAKGKLEARARERDAVKQEEYAAKVARREAQRAEGKKPRGQEPTPPATGPQPNDQINLTDEESRIMPANSGFVQAYNAQATVDVETLLITTAHVTQAPNDKQQVQPTLARLATLPDTLGRVDALLADTGYLSRGNVTACQDAGIEPLIALGRDSHHLPLAERFGADPSPPETDDPMAHLAHRLKTQAGRSLYALRKQTVEPVFGIIKQAMGFRQFLLRGMEKVSGEWTLVSLAWNIKRLNVLRLA
jgi:transposase